MNGNSQIFVDLAGLHDACLGVGEDIKKLRGELLNADAQIQHGPRFGLSSPSGEANAAQRALVEALRMHATNSGRHITVAEQLSTTLDSITKNYKEADAIIRLDVARVQELLDEALRSESTPNRGPIP